MTSFFSMKRIKYIPISLFLLAALTACEDKELMPDGIHDDIERRDDLPIELSAFIEVSQASRSVDDAKTMFSAGDSVKGVGPDVIHVQSTFLYAGGKVEKRYCALEYTEEGKWLPKGNGRFAWPNDAISGSFTAYYVYGSSAALTDNTSSEQELTVTPFSSLVDGTDPLRADITGVRYGHTVELPFKHLLTHLTLIELDAGIDDALIFTIPENDANEYNQHTFNNAFSITLDKDSNGEPEIKFEYLQVPGQISKIPDAVAIKSNTQIIRDKVTREESSQVGFFLEPGSRYNTFEIYFSNEDMYLSYKNTDRSSQDKLLEENNRYFFNVKKSAGITIKANPEERWDESDDFTTIVDAEGFLRAINTNNAYKELDPATGDSILILEATTNPAGTLLKRNVKFATPYYHVFPHANPDPEKEGTSTPYDFVPSVGGDNVFDGGYHYIKELQCPLFYENFGTIKNLGLSGFRIGCGDAKYGEWESSMKDVKSDVVVGDFVTSHEYQRTGALATNNMGTVQNIRVKDISIKVGINALEDNEAHNAGVLIGVNNTGGLVEDIYLSGNISLEIENYLGYKMVPTVNIGGLTGQNIGTLKEVQQLVDNRESVSEKPAPVNIKVTNRLVGDNGQYNVGGIVGNNTGLLTDINIPTTSASGYAVRVDNSSSSGVLARVGGIAGNADYSQGNEISSCLLGSGIVKAGASMKYQAIDAFSYTGGIIGVVNVRTIVANNTVFCDVEGYTPDDWIDVTCAAGGAFGYIKYYISSSNNGSIDTNANIESIAAYGNSLTGKNAGCFAGEVPDGKDWDTDYAPVADVKKFGNIDYIGTHTELP